MIFIDQYNKLQGPNITPFARAHDSKSAGTPGGKCPGDLMAELGLSPVIIAPQGKYPPSREGEGGNIPLLEGGRGEISPF